MSQRHHVILRHHNLITAAGLCDEKMRTASSLFFAAPALEFVLSCLELPRGISPATALHQQNSLREILPDVM